MHILIVEDEYSIASDIEWNCRQILGKKIRSLHKCYTLQEAKEHIQDNLIDLLLLDLNLGGKNGYEILQTAATRTFETIIISAHVDQALKAFQYDVLDFLPKPFEQRQLRKAFDHFFTRRNREERSKKYLTVKKNNEHNLLAIDDIIYFKAANYYVEAILKNGEMEILDKSLERLLQILPQRFFRIHRSCIVDINFIESFTPVINGSSQISLKNGTELKLSKKHYKELRTMMNH